MRSLVQLIYLILALSVIPDTLPKSEEVNIKMVGDCLMHSGLIEQGLKTGSYDFMFDNVRDEISSADLSIINQETIFINDSSEYSSYPRFGSPIGIGISEIASGFDIIAHATNHTVDKGIKGILDTLDFWEGQDGIDVLGIHRGSTDSDICYRAVNGIKVGLVNYTYGLNGLDSTIKGVEFMVDRLSDSDILDTLSEARLNSDILIAILHIGDEYTKLPSRYTIEQVDKFIDLGVDVVLCSHPHVVQGYGVRRTCNGNDALVYYSLGNFISQQDKEPRLLGGMADFTYRLTRTSRGSVLELVDYDMKPLVTHAERGNYTTYFLEDYTDELVKRNKVLKRLSLDDLFTMFDSYVNCADDLFTYER